MSQAYHRFLQHALSRIPLMDSPTRNRVLRAATAWGGTEPGDAAADLALEQVLVDVGLITAGEAVSFEADVAGEILVARDEHLRDLVIDTNLDRILVLI